MKNYFFIVEGVHDIAAIGKYLSLFSIKEIAKLENLPSVWNNVVPRSFPYNGDLLKRVPYPNFYKSEEISIAIMGANGDSKIVDMLNMLSNLDYEKISGIAIFSDADNNAAIKRFEKLKIEIENKVEDDIKKYIGKVNNSINTNDNGVKFGVYVFPDNVSQGVLEDILLEGAWLEYPELVSQSEAYFDILKNSKLNYLKDSHFLGSKGKKVLVGAISNNLNPGMSNQVSIKQDKWFTKDSILKKNSHQNNLKLFLEEILEITID